MSDAPKWVKLRGDEHVRGSVPVDAKQVTFGSTISFAPIFMILVILMRLATNDQTPIWPGSVITAVVGSFVYALLTYLISKRAQIVVTNRAVHVRGRAPIKIGANTRVGRKGWRTELVQVDDKRHGLPPVQSLDELTELIGGSNG